MLNFGVLLKAIANSGEIEKAFGKFGEIATDAKKIKEDIAEDIASFKAGTPPNNVNTLQLAEELIADIGDVMVSVGALTGVAPLSAIGALLAVRSVVSTQ